MTSPATERPRRLPTFMAVLRWIGRRRAPLVIIPTMFGLIIAGSIGAKLLLREVPKQVSTDAICWDGTPGTTDDCPLPEGKPGLLWVFPSFRPDGGKCEDFLATHPNYIRPTMWLCKIKTESGKVSIRYSELQSVGAARRHFDGEFRDGSRVGIRESGEVVRWLWTGNDRGRAAVMYADYPYAVEIDAVNGGALAYTLDRFLKYREPAYITVQP